MELNVNGLSMSYKRLRMRKWIKKKKTRPTYLLSKINFKYNDISRLKEKG